MALAPAPLVGVRARGGGGRGSVRDPITRVLSRSSLTGLYILEVRRILELRERGLGVTEIAKRVYGDRRKRYRVWRILRKLEAEELLLPGARHVAGGGDAEGAPYCSMQHEPEDGRVDPKTLPAGPHWIPRLGPTQRLVLDALMTLHLPSTPSEIREYIREVHGLRLSRNAVWQALRRLEERGVVYRLEGGRYKLASAGSGILVENLRVDGARVWSTRDMGRPAALEEALTIAALRGRTRPVEQVELFRLGNGSLEERARALRKLGWRITKIYLNEDQGLKLEHQFWDPPLPASPGEAEAWTQLYREATSLALELADYILGKTT